MNAVVVAGALAFVGLALLFIRLGGLERSNRLSRLEAKVDALLKNAGITFDAFQNVPPEVREALPSAH